MDVDHVAFAAMGKFDGHRPRRLTAGRGGADRRPRRPRHARRHVRHHRAVPAAGRRGGGRGGGAQLRAARPAVLAQQRPRPQPCRRAARQPDGAAAGPGLVKGNDAADLETLAALARDPEIRRLAHGRRQVRLLWEACQIPDFRKLADDTHTRLCARVFGHIARDQHLPTDWLAGQIGALARADGDIDTLMQRLAGVRVWSYIAARADWVQDSAALAGPRARGRGPAVGRAARAADQPLRRPPRRAPDAPAGGGRRPGAALRGHPPRRGHGRGPSGRPHRRLRLLPRPGGRGRREAARAARRAAGAARGDAAPRRRGGDRAGCRLRVRRRPAR